MILHVNQVQPVQDHILSISFNDGTSKTVDVLPLLHGPVFEPLRDPAYFARVTVDPVCKTVVWPNGADLAPEALYELNETKEYENNRRQLHLITKD